MDNLVPDRLVRSPLTPKKPMSTVSATGGSLGVTIVERPVGLALQVAARRGGVGAVANAMRSVFNVDLPLSPGVVHTAAFSALSSGPGRWLVIAADENSNQLMMQLREALNGLAAVTDQSHAHIGFGLAGPCVCDALEKLVGIDLHASEFPVGASAMTAIAHIPIQIWRSPNHASGQCYEIIGPQSYADSLWHHLFSAAAAFGAEAKFS